MLSDSRLTASVGTTHPDRARGFSEGTLGRKIMAAGHTRWLSGIGASSQPLQRGGQPT
jgi:hypothetical protein